MQTKMVQLEERIAELEGLFNEVASLSDLFFSGAKVQPQLSIKGEGWFRGARELLAQSNFSGIGEFDNCYKGSSYSYGIKSIIHRDSRGDWDAGDFNMAVRTFKQNLQQARGLLISVVEELKSRELPILSALSFTLSADEFDTARELAEAGNSDESILRAAGVIARVALERHLFTLAESRKLAIALNPPSKKKAEASDVLTALSKAAVITGIQQAELQSLFRIANNCAHPKEAVKPQDVQRLIERSRELASVIT